MICRLVGFDRDPTSDATSLVAFKDHSFISFAWFQNSTANSSKSYSTQTGFYTKIGNLVVAHFYLVLTFTKGTQDNVSLTGLPFTSASDSGNTGASTITVSNNNSYGMILAPVVANDTKASIYSSDGLGNADTHMPTNPYISGTVIYKTA